MRMWNLVKESLSDDIKNSWEITIYQVVKTLRWVFRYPILPNCKFILINCEFSENSESAMTERII